VTLAHLRFPAAALSGRRYPEEAHPYRNEFQRDRDRIVHSRAFRRLEDKTQVFGERFSDHFRNRLTHTIEVAQIARTLAGALGLDEDFTEALALAHDIGHPPFAHAGEQELDRQMRRFGERFNHNLHALHIVERFEQRYARFPGLNLTFEVREGILKHSRDFEPGELAEAEEYLAGLRPPLEAQLIDLADEIAYNTADLDDGFSAGLYTLDDIAAAVPVCALLREEIAQHYPAAAENVQFQEILRRLIDHLVSGLIGGTERAVRDAGVQTTGDVRRHPLRLVKMTPDAAESNKALKRFLFERVYSIPLLAEERKRASEGIARLFAFFMANPSELPASHLERSAELPLHRVVCEYIAGMTDGFFRRTAARLLGASSGLNPRSG
jgi:dGTPase